MRHPLMNLVNTNLLWRPILKNDGEKFFDFEILRAPLELLLPSSKNLPRKAELAWQVRCIYSVDSIKRTVHLAFHGLFFS
jgi:hypothetical protein